MELLEKLNELNSLIGNTPLLRLNFNNDISLYGKLEYYNYMGSIKDRPAFYILKKAIEEGVINKKTMIIESTSGNFGLALAGICKKLNLQFIPVIDPNITIEKEKILRLLCPNVIKVTEKDETGGYLLTRIKTVKEYVSKISNSYNPNQYENKNNYLCYYNTLGEELCNSFDHLDYAFISVSSGGTITGLSLRLKEKFRNIKIMAVDIEGSLIFHKKPKVRKISGLGASFRTPILDNAMIDDVIILSQSEIVIGCNKLLSEHSIFAGGSSGAAYLGAIKTFEKTPNLKGNAVFICPDKGNAYTDNIYDNDWVNNNILETELVKI